MSAFTEHDLEHHHLKVQVLVLQQLVLKLFVVVAKDRADGDLETARGVARALLRKSTASLKDIPQFPQLHPAEQALIHDESLELFSDLEQHLEFILGGAP